MATQGTQDCLMLMIASSSLKSQFEGRKKFVDDGVNHKGPLPGIKYDLKAFRNKYKLNTNHYIETSQDEKMLLTKSYILNWLEKYFSEAGYDTYIFYSGHGHQGGDLAVETVERPEADKLPLETIVNLWTQKRPMQKCHLYIFMDSCYSGAWAYKLGDMGNKGISIFASSDRNETSIDCNGGLLFKSIMGPENQIDATWNTIKRYQNPVFINKTDRVSKMEKDHLKLLNQNIANVTKIQSGGTPYSGPVNDSPINNPQQNSNSQPQPPRPQPQQQQQQQQHQQQQQPPRPPQSNVINGSGGNVQYIIEGAQDMDPQDLQQIQAALQGGRLGSLGGGRWEGFGGGGRFQGFGGGGRLGGGRFQGFEGFDGFGGGRLGGGRLGGGGAQIVNGQVFINGVNINDMGYGNGTTQTVYTYSNGSGTRTVTTIQGGKKTTTTTTAKSLTRTPKIDMQGQIPVVVYPNGEKYQGQLANNKRNGKGLFEYASGTIYDGEWKNDLKNGKGICYYSNNDQYDGNWVNDKREGKGIYRFTDGKIFEGDWKDNSRHGQGTLFFVNGDTYKGSWVADKQCGQGVYFFKSGKKYTGQWKDNKYNGHGVMKFANGDQYEGEWKDDKMHGKGIFTNSNGDSYDGDWKNDARNGFGLYSYANGDQYEGEFRDDKFNGQGSYFYADGTEETGLWQNDEFVGE